MIEHFNKSSKYPLVPFFKNQMRNPVIFPIHFIKKLKNITGDRGAKKIIIKNKFNKIIFFRSKIFSDIDTIDDIKNF